MRFNPPPGWPQPPEGSSPPPGWQPDPRWPPAPFGWPFWVEDAKSKSRFGWLLDRGSNQAPAARQPSPTPIEAQPPPSRALPAETSPPAPNREAGHRGRASLRFGGATSGLVPFPLWGQRGWARVEVAGESHYASALKAIVNRNSGEREGELNVTAVLMPESRNRHDRNAVKVLVDGNQVGYLPKEEAARYTGVLQQLVEAGFSPEVTARIWAGETEDYELDRRGNLISTVRLIASVRLDLDEPHMLVPGNLPPEGAHEVLPVGGSIQVSGEDKHVDAIAPFVGSVGQQWVYVTLHELREQLARSTKTVLEVRIDGGRVGQLSPKMSGELLAAVRYLNQRGLMAAARGVVKGNRAAAEVTVYVKRAHELGDEWFETVDHRYS